jgi:rRNA-processing protein FCF1
MAPIVVPDTNAFYGDPMMRQRNFRIVLAEHDKGNFVLAIPEVVLGELPKLFREQLESARAKITSGLAGVRALGVEVDDVTLDAQSKYSPDLRANLKKRQVVIAPLPKVTVEELYEQAIVERRPFQSKGRGFKDALIWCTVRELAADDEVILITNNSSDFAESPKTPTVLHHDLREDLAADGHRADRVKLLASIEDFIAEHVTSSAVHLDDARHRLATDVVWASELRELVRKGLMELSTGRDPVTIIRSENASVDFNYVDAVDLGDIAILEAYETGDDDLVSLEVVAHAELQINFTADAIAAEWLVAERADVEFDLFEETFAQGHTLGNPVVAHFAVDCNVVTHELSEPEKIYVEDDRE